MTTTRKMHTGKPVWPLRSMLAVLFIASFTHTVRAPMAHAATVTKEGGAKVSIVNFAFTPAVITIAPGESVTWTNDDGAPHGLEYQDGAPGTDLFLPGASVSRRFDQPGTYDYNCSVHPYMTGRVVVRTQ
jgi:plastocyanin